MFTGKEHILVLVLGCSGSGKTCLSRQPGMMMGLPIVHLDGHFWHPGWVETQAAEWRDRVFELLKRPR